MFLSLCMKLEEKPCVPNPCQNGGTCKEEDGEEVCNCQPGFLGDMCEIQGKHLKPWMYSLFEKHFQINSFSCYNFLTIAWYIEY